MSEASGVGSLGTSGLPVTSDDHREWCWWIIGNDDWPITRGQ